MSLDVVRGRTDNIVATKELVRILEANQLEKTDETLYLGYPLSANSDSAVILDALLISERYGFSKDDPNWNKLHLFHAWGSQSEQGLYSKIARSLNQIPANYTNAKLKFGRNLAFSGICNELYQLIPEDYEPLYDLLLIDEAQDMPAAFFQIAYKCTKHPKRLVWAYDELQNLNASVMPTIEDMFGFDSTGKPLIDLKNEPDEPMQDIVLPICYRNPPWILSLAHSLGFGIYRSQLVQHFETLGLWKDIGYKIDRGTLSYGKKVVLSRSLDSTPNYFFELLDPKDVIWTKSFDDADSQYP